MLRHRPRFRRAGGTAVGVAIAAVLLASCGSKSGPDNEQNALRPAGPYADQILDLTRPFFWIAVVVGIGVIAGTIYVALRFRTKPDDDKMPKQTHGNTVLEVSWTIIPALILAVMAVPTVAVVFDLAERPTGPEVVNVTVTARQWWWQYTYEDEDGLQTANELHIPAGRPVALTLVGPPACAGERCYDNGVLHSFWVPELNGKKDVVPGRRQFLKIFADTPGTYRGQCAEYCGLSHADMRLSVIAHDEAGYEAWLASQKSPGAGKAALEEGVQNAKWGCATCHSFEPNVPGAVGPNLTHLADRERFAAEVYEMNFENLWQWIHNAPSMKPMGDLVQHMPNFSDTPAIGGGPAMSEQDAKDIACFLLENTATTPDPEKRKGCPA
jgi:cytochrome c oxidase subunit 2